LSRAFEARATETAGELFAQTRAVIVGEFHLGAPAPGERSAADERLAA
jgi:hypothetical protein